MPKRKKHIPNNEPPGANTHGSAGGGTPENIERVAAARALAGTTRELSRKAKRHGFAMIAYLLDRVALEAEDCENSIDGR